MPLSATVPLSPPATRTRAKRQRTADNADALTVPLPADDEDAAMGVGSLTVQEDSAADWDGMGPEDGDDDGGEGLEEWHVEDLYPAATPAPFATPRPLTAAPLRPPQSVTPARPHSIKSGQRSTYTGNTERKTGIVEREAAEPARDGQADVNVFDVSQYEQAAAADEAEEKKKAAPGAANGISDDDIFNPANYGAVDDNPFVDIGVSMPRGTDIVHLGKDQQPVAIIAKGKGKGGEVTITVSPFEASPCSFERVEQVAQQGRSALGLNGSNKTADITEDAIVAACAILGFTKNDAPAQPLAPADQQRVTQLWRDTAKQLLSRVIGNCVPAAIILPVTTISCPFLVQGHRVAKMLGSISYNQGFSCGKMFSGQAYHFYPHAPAGVKALPAHAAGSTTPLAIVLDAKPDDIMWRATQNMIVKGVCRVVFVPIAIDKVLRISASLRAKFPNRSLSVQIRLLGGKSLVCIMFGGLQDLAGVYASIMGLHARCTAAKDQRAQADRRVRFNPEAWITAVLKQFPNKDQTLGDLAYGADWATY